jgi:cytochrome c peroxidase
VSARFDTPSLALLSGRAPYFHDGRYATLRELLSANGDKMGHTSHLSETDRSALEAFLETL